MAQPHRSIGVVRRCAGDPHLDSEMWVPPRPKKPEDQRVSLKEEPGRKNHFTPQDECPPYPQPSTTSSATPPPSSTFAPPSPPPSFPTPSSSPAPSHPAKTASP